MKSTEERRRESEAVQARVLARTLGALFASRRRRARAGPSPPRCTLHSEFLRPARERLERAKVRFGFVPTLVGEFEGWETTKDYVEAGLGVAIVPSLCRTERDRVCRVPHEGALPARRYGCITRRERLAPLAVQRFLRVLGFAHDVTDEGRAVRASP